MVLTRYLLISISLALTWVCTPRVRAETVDFDREILPIFKSRCWDCHSGTDKGGGIGFDDYASLFAEADSGLTPIMENDVAASELLKRVTATQDELRMPPEGDRLPKSEIELLRRWIGEGASRPPSQIQKNDQHKGDREHETSHWSFQPLSAVDPPSVTDDDWPNAPLDRFLQAKREAAGLSVAPDASARSLIRRASFVLTGLPPTSSEVRRFVSAVETKGKQAAFSELINRMLDDPSYGERWGRHWMDWVRYADTAGDNSDFPIPQAYLYRNYIVESLNCDIPYDRFLVEQVAGDLLPAESQAERNRLTIATGYLAMSRRFGSLIERYPWHLTIEDTIDNLGRTMMGLTLSCARCHDHKFDPISTRDYYGIYGIFASTRYPQPGLELFQSQQHLVPLIPNSEVEKTYLHSRENTDSLTKELDSLLAKCESKKIENARLESSVSIEEQRKMKAELDGMLIKARRAGEKLAEHLKKLPPIPTAYAVQEGRPQNAKLQIKGEPTRPGAEVQRRFPEILGGFVVPDAVAKSSSGRLQLAKWIANKDNPLTARVIVNRVWQRHFGIGIVPSTSDFGLRGQLPTHPDLLDWLTADFINNGWSLKHLHRTIMSSRTWQLSSQDVPGNQHVDPSNHLYWRANRRRLDAESIRDTLKFLAGSLDRTPQSKPYPIPPQSDWKYTQHHPFKDEYSSDKRSVYLMTKRLTQESYFQTFDGPDPNVCTSDRDESVTPLQALFFVNDEFFHEQADMIAKQVVEHSHSVEGRIDFTFRLLLGRPADPSETEIVMNHLAEASEKISNDIDADRQVWASLVRSVLRLNEFLYVD